MACPAFVTARTVWQGKVEWPPFRRPFSPVLLIFPVTFTLKPFLAKKGHSPEEVDKMYAAWVKSCLLQVTLWSHPYVKDGDF